MILIETDRLRLRNVLLKDVEIIYDYRNNYLCAQYQRGQTKDHEGITSLVKRRTNDMISVDEPFMIAVALKDTDEMIGEIVVMPKDGTISLGYTIHYAYHVMDMHLKHYLPSQTRSTTDTKNGTLLVLRTLLTKQVWHY